MQPAYLLRTRDYMILFDLISEAGANKQKKHQQLVYKQEKFQVIRNSRIRTDQSHFLCQV